MPLYLRKKIAAQPQGQIKVNFAHPLSLGLIGAWTGSQPFVNLVTNQRLTMNTIDPADLVGGVNGAEFRGRNAVGGYLNLIPSNLPTAGACVTLIYRRRDLPNLGRQSSAFGISSLGSDRWNVNLPWDDGTVYFDFGGYLSNKRVSVGGLTFGNDIWSFNNGVSGLQIWQNGIKRADNNAGTQTRTAGSNFNIFGNSSDPIDNASTTLVLVHNRSLSASEIVSLWQNPWQVFVPAATYLPTGAAPPETTIYEFQTFGRGVGRGIARGIA